MAQQKVYTIRLPKWLVDAYEREARRRGMSRSELMKRALELYAFANNLIDRNTVEYKHVKLKS